MLDPNDITELGNMEVPPHDMAGAATVDECADERASKSSALLCAPVKSSSEF